MSSESEIELKLEDLSYEVLLKIFSVAKLKLGEIFCVGLVCREWYALMNENSIWRRRCLVDLEIDLGKADDCKTLYYAHLLDKVFREEMERIEETRKRENEDRMRHSSNRYYGNYAAFVTDKDELHDVDESYKCTDSDGIYSTVDSNDFIYHFDDVNVDQINEVLMKKGVILLKGFCDLEKCETLMSVTDKLGETYYNEQNLANHSAYPMDDQGSRKSWAFALPGNEKNDLPCVHLKNDEMDLDKESFEAFSDTTDTVKKLLNINKGRTLFNIQKYSNTCPSIRPHHDGEVMSITVKNGKLHEVSALFPETVALLTLKNEAENGGTKIHFDMEPGCHEYSWRYNLGTKKHKKIVICAQAGDLLIFNNIKNEHSVDSLLSKNNENENIRHIIGWRSLEENCVRMNTKRLDNRMYDKLSYEKAKYFHKKHLDRGFQNLMI